MAETEASEFIAKWREYTEGDPRREWLLSRVAAVIAECDHIRASDKARPGERVRAVEAELKALETFARAVKVDLKARTDGSVLETSGDILEFARETRRRIDDGLADLERRDPKDYAAACDSLKRMAAERSATATP